MDIQEKRNLIKENKEGVIAALNTYLDSIYNLTDEYFDDEGKLLSFLNKDEKLETFVKELRERAVEYENVREKVIKDDFSLSLLEINLIGLSYLFLILKTENLIEKLKQAQQETKNIFNLLIEDKDKEKFRSEVLTS